MAGVPDLSMGLSVLFVTVTVILLHLAVGNKESEACRTGFFS
jgi:hypothetical protein